MKKKITTAAFAALASVSAFAQNVTLEGALQKANSTLSSSAGLVVNLISLIIGLVGVAMLAWQGAKYLKGEGQSNDALMKIGGGLLIIVVLLQIIKAVFLNL